VIKPHGADALTPLFVADQSERQALILEAQSLTQVMVSSATAANAVMLGGGYFTPLPGYMNKSDALSVAADMRTQSGLFFPVPVLNLLAEANFDVGQRIALRDPNVLCWPFMEQRMFNTPVWLRFWLKANMSLPAIFRFLISATLRQSLLRHFLLQCRYEKKSPSVDGKRWWHFKHAIQCTVLMRNFARWRWMQRVPTAV